jgi:hypothetical protein
MNAWIEGKIQFEGRSVEETTAELKAFAGNFFPGALEYKSDFHSTLLYIGAGFTEEQLKEPFLEAGVTGYFFRSQRYVLMVGGETDELILLAYSCPTQCHMFRRLDELYKAHDIKPDHKLHSGGPGLYGYTPHVTLAKFEDRRTAKASLEFGLKAGAVKALLNTSQSLTASDFHLFGDYDKKGKFVIA